MTLRYTFRCSFDDLASLTQGLSGIEAQEILRGCWQLIKVEAPTEATLCFLSNSTVAHSLF